MPRHIERVKHKHTTKIDGVRVEIGSAKWEAFSFKWRYYRFLEALIRNPEEENPLDHINWANYWPEVHAILKEWNMVEIPKDWYKIAANEYQLELENGKPAYKNKIHGFGWWDPKAKKFNLDPISIKG